jgi:hypothetical protein
MPRKPITICGVDPGLATGGIVLVSKDSDEILGVQRLYSTMKKKGDDEPLGDVRFTDSVNRAAVISKTVLDFIDVHKPNLVVVESFVDFGSQAKRTNTQGGAFFAKDRWKTPLVIGYLSAGLAERSFPLIYTNPQILRQYADEISMLGGKRDEDVIAPNDRLLTSDHLIKAWCHADYASRHWEEIRDQITARVAAEKELAEEQAAKAARKAAKSAPAKKPTTTPAKASAKKTKTAPKTRRAKA